MGLGFCVSQSPPATPAGAPAGKVDRTAQGRLLAALGPASADAGEWFSSAARDKTAGADMSASAASMLQKDGSLIMYWLDAHEEKFASPGTVWLFGKVLAPAPAGQPATWLSCCVKVNKVDRNMYIVPRKFLTDAAGQPTEEEVEALNFENEASVFCEFQARMQKARLPVAGNVKAKLVPRMNVFSEEKMVRRAPSARPALQLRGGQDARPPSRPGHRHR